MERDDRLYDDPETKDEETEETEETNEYDEGQTKPPPKKPS